MNECGDKVTTTTTQAQKVQSDGNTNEQKNVSSGEFGDENCHNHNPINANIANSNKNNTTVTDKSTAAIVIVESETIEGVNLSNQNQRNNLDKDNKDKDLKMVHNGDGINVDDGSDERMLGGNEGKNLAKKDEVKFISGDQQNGDAKIDIGNLDKAFTGMTKEELMKYANDPFWIRLRWIFFVSFWLIWAGMLIGAILIIINAPKCAAPTPLRWYKQGPLIVFNSNKVNADDIEQAKKLKAKGAIYELPPEQTYSVKEEPIENNIKQLVASYKDTNVNVILDITPNFVTKDSKMFKEALQDPNRRSSFIWLEGLEGPKSWRSIVNGSAWHKINQTYVLSQFGEGKFDLFMNDSYVKNELTQTLRHLIQLGVKGFRFTNAKYFILKKDLNEESPSTLTHNYTHDQYGFWTHKYTTFQEGLGDLLNEFRLIVVNASNDEAFLSVSEDTIRPEVFKTNTDSFGIDIPIFGRFTEILGNKLNSTDSFLYNELKKSTQLIGNTTTWLQWIYNLNNMSHVDPSAYYMFMSILPGTPVVQAKSAFLNLSHSLITQVENLRLSPSYMHGDFNIYHSGEIIAYSRIKSGNPGFFTVFNPTEMYVVGNFSYADLPDKMTFDLLSDNYNITDVVTKGKVSTDAIQLSPFSSAILTYVPVKKN